MGAAEAHCDGIKAFSETDFAEDLPQITVPTFVMHGDDDQIILYTDSTPLSVKLLKHSTLKTCQGHAPWHLYHQPEIINVDLLAFVRS